MGEYVHSDMMLDAEGAKKVSADAYAQYGNILIACSAAGCLGRVAQFDVVAQIASTDTHEAIARAKPDVVLPDTCMLICGEHKANTNCAVAKGGIGNERKSISDLPN